MPESAGSSAAERLARPVPEHGVELTWLGQSGVLLRAPGASLLVDPFLSPHPDRLVPAPDRPEGFAGIDAVLVTHEHLDHLDGDACRALAGASPETAFVIPRPITAELVELGIGEDRIVAMQPGERAAVAAARVAAVPACHGVHPADAYSFGRELSDGLVRFLGYVVEMGGLHLYHAGDTIAFDGLAESLRELEVEVALLPINGRRPEREAQDIVGNFEPAEAAELAAAAGARVAVPMHYDMFAANLGDVGAFVAHVSAEHPELAVIVPGRFEPLRLA
jgi:L-ascorbate metabolism protein UlaG (beta-lactamase superfamily)